MKRSISFSIAPISNGFIVATFSDYGQQEQFYFATQVETIDALPAIITEAIAEQEVREERQAGEVGAINRKLGYPILGESHAESVQRKQGAVNSEWREKLNAMSSEPAMTVGEPQVFDNAEEVTEGKGQRPVFRRPGPPAE